MIDRFLGDAFGVLYCQFWSAVLQCIARLPKHTLNYWLCSQWCPVLTWVVFKCSIVHRRSVAAVLCMLYKIRWNRMPPLNGALPGLYVPVRVTRGARVTYRCTYMRCFAAEPRSTAGLLFPSKCPCGTILPIPYSMVWDWRVSRAGPMHFYSIKLLYPNYSHLLLFLFSFFRQ